jgi:probable pyridine nucleotide-disulfide oxidoreductase
MNLHNLETALGRDLIIGTARFVDPTNIEVTTTDGTTRLLTAERLFINTGTRPLIPAIPGLKDIGFLTSESMMELEQLPEHLLVLGSGYIGLEFAQMFRRFGCHVTVIGQSDRILSSQDPDLAILQRRGYANAVQSLLEREGLETNVPGIWALGDINGGPQYTHVSLDDYRVIKANLIDGGNRSTRDRPVPSCLFIDPELEHVGLTETEAQQQGYTIRVAKLNASAIPRAQTLGRTDRLLKAIVDTKTDRILGCSLLCHAAGEMISTVQMVMQAQMPYTVLRDSVLTHPTMTEGLNLLFSKL